MSIENKTHVCDFCGKSQQIVDTVVNQKPPRSKLARKLLPDGVDICNECIDICTQILYEKQYDFSTVAVIPKDAIEMMGFKPVFHSRNIKPKKNTCFYLGPFSEPFNTIYKDHIVSALNEAEFSVSRADEIFSTNIIVEDIWTGITSASLIVADVTGRNPNVMYEIGMAHTVGRPVLVISQSVEDLPFDLRHRRCVIYEYTPRGCTKLEEDLLQTAKIVQSVSV